MSRTRPRLALCAFLITAGCGKDAARAPEPTPPRDAAPVVARDDAAVTPPTPAPDAGPAPLGPNLYTLGDARLAVGVTVALPAGWQDRSSPGNAVFAHLDGAWLKITLTCHGACGATRAAANIAAAAREAFEFTTSDSHVPRLAPVWDEEVTELRPGVFRWAFHGAASEGPRWEVHHRAVERVIGDHVLQCKIELTNDAIAMGPALDALCDALDPVVEPDPRFAWKVVVTPATAPVAQREQLELRIEVTNRSKDTLDPLRRLPTFVVDGAPSQALAMAFGNGGRSRDWSALAPGATVTDRRVMGFVDGAGEHTIVLTHLGIELARTTVTLTP